MAAPEPNRASVLIREGRKRAGFTQRELAEKLGVTIGTISSYERGISYPKIDLLYALCDVLHINPVELLRANQ